MGIKFKIVLALAFIGMITASCVDIGVDPDATLLEMKSQVDPEGAGSVNPPFGSYEVGKEITIEALDANPEDSIQFLGWDGDTTASDNPLTFSINSDMNLTARFGKPSFFITTSVIPEGVGEVIPDSSSFVEGEKASIRAEGNVGYKFINWSGDTSATANPLEFPVYKSMNIVANFERTEVSLTTSVTSDGTGTVTPESGTYDYGSTISLKATPANNYSFVEWSGDTTSTENPLSFEITRDMNIVANFGKDIVTLTTDVLPAGSGSIEPASGNYEIGSHLSISAVPETGYKFTGWSGDTTATSNPLDFAITDNMHLVANFEKIQVQLTTEINSTGTGTVSPESGTYDYGSTISLEATPANNYSFVEWSGDTTSTENPLSFEITRDMNIVANFEKNVFSLSTSVSPAEAGSVSPSSGEYEAGSEIEVNATANEGFAFSAWEGAVNSSSNPVTVTMDSDKQLKAVFDKISRPFANNIIISNSDGLSTTLTFGMNADATSGFDSGLDRDLPPTPLPPAFDARFLIPDYGLAEDYRPVQISQIVWELHIQSAEQDTVSLDWDFSETRHLGSLKLVDAPDSPTLEIDMKNRNSYSISGSVETVLYIISKR